MNIAVTIGVTIDVTIHVRIYSDTDGDTNGDINSDINNYLSSVPVSRTLGAPGRPMCILGCPLGAPARAKVALGHSRQSAQLSGARCFSRQSGSMRGKVTLHQAK